MPLSLILVRHAAPKIESDVAPSEWALSEAGRAAAQSLGERLSKLGSRAIVASPEAKARMTAELIALSLGSEVNLDAGFVEHRRPGLGFLPPKEFESAIRLAFARPDERVFGGESANEALARFESAIERHKARPLIVVTHGTILSLFIGRHSRMEPFSLWTSLKLPEAFLLDEENRSFERMS